MVAEGKQQGLSQVGFGECIRDKNLCSSKAARKGGDRA